MECTLINKARRHDFWITESEALIGGVNPSAVLKDEVVAILSSTAN